MDLTKESWQVPLDTESQKKSAFITDLGLLEFKILLFGLTDAGDTFHRHNQILCGFQDFAINYIDDIALFSNT